MFEANDIIFLKINELEHYTPIKFIPYSVDQIGYYNTDYSDIMFDSIIISNYKDVRSHAESDLENIMRERAQKVGKDLEADGILMQSERIVEIYNGSIKAKIKKQPWHREFIIQQRGIIGFYKRIK